MKKFKIFIDNPQPIYSSGSVIRGNIILNSFEDEAVGSVRITFFGRGKTKLYKQDGNNRTVYRGRAPLFIQTKILYTGHFKLRSGRYSWPFEFTFPARTDPRCADDVFDADNVFLKTGVPHPLPPTFNLYEGSVWKQCKVEYKLVARLDRPGNQSIFSSNHLEDVVELMYLPLRVDAEPESRCYTIGHPWIARTLLLLPEKQNLTLKDKLHSLFKAGNLPSASFMLRLTYPTRTYPGQSLPIQLCVTDMVLSENVATPPTVFLQSVSVEIKSFFRFRAIGFLRTPSDQVTEKAVLLKVAGDPVPVPVVRTTDSSSSLRQRQPSQLQHPADCLDFAKLRGDAALATPELHPSFRSINVAVGYRLKVKMRLRCVDKSLDFAISEPLEMLSLVYAVSSGAGQAGAAVEQPLAFLLAEDLPRYTEHEGPGGDNEVGQGPSDQPPQYGPSASAVVPKEIVPTQQ